MRKTKSAALAALAFALFMILAGPAAARDRNDDRIPDRWEKRHHLSLKVKQAKRDQDGDGLRNRGEFKAGLDPRDDDSDNDGIEDGDENAGTIESFDAATGKLTIKLFNGDSVTGLVADDTKIECGADDGARRPTTAMTTTATTRATTTATTTTATTTAIVVTTTRATTTARSAAPRRSRPVARSRRPTSSWPAARPRSRRSSSVGREPL